MSSYSLSYHIDSAIYFLLLLDKLNLCLKELLTLLKHIVITTIYLWNIIYCSTVGGRDRMVVGFTTTCAISAYHH
jgi:hypothetical protein